MKKAFAWLVVPFAVAAAVLLTQGGCEEADGMGSLTIEPEFVDLTRILVTNKDVTLTFAVTEGLRGLSLPLKWTVSDPTLGRVFFSTGNTAAYVPDVMVFSDGSWSWENGVNAILVEDQYGAQGMATVAQ